MDEERHGSVREQTSRFERKRDERRECFISHYVYGSSVFERSEL